jgi:Protein of unknown function (DUF3298)
MSRYWAVGVVMLLLVTGCGAPNPAPNAVATQVAVFRAAAETLTAEAPGAMADLVATEVAATRAAAATLTAEPLAATTQPLLVSESAITVLQPSAEVPELGRGFALVMQEIKDDGQAGFGYHLWAPRLLGPNTAVSGPFNQAVDTFLTYALDDVRQGVVEAEAGPDSSLWITHTITAATEGLISVLFYVDGYVMGAAHPFHYSYALNYDLNEAQVLGLSELFLPGTDYLEVISRYCLDDLKRQGVLEWKEGALPAPENYQRWNITPDGLLISFDEYTVAPYAAGPQAVLVSYEVLGQLIDPGGPLAPFLG